jgi:lipoate-protein ligase B
MSRGRWHALGVVEYRAALEIQERIANERAEGRRSDTLLLLEHPPTITLGRRATDGDVLWDVQRLARSGIAVERVGRGGRATYHGPGQLVGYPIVLLEHRGRAVRRFVAELEGLLLEISEQFGVRADIRRGHPGIWVGEKKLASIGIEVRRGVSRHGFALNVDVDLTPFAAIVPCGVPGLELTDLSRERGRALSVTAVADAVVCAWRSRFGELEEENLDGLEAVG